MKLTRRSFLEFVASLPLVGAALPKYVPTAQPLWKHGDQALPFVRLRDGQAFMYVHATNELRRGDVVYWNGECVGIAAWPIDAGNYGFVEVKG